MIEITYEGSVLKYYEEKEGFVCVLVHSTDKGVWIKKEDIFQHSFSAMQWLEFLKLQKEFVYESNSVVLRQNPDLKSQEIIKISGGRFLILLSGKTDGIWAEAEVEEYDKDYYAGDAQIIRRFKGWIQAIDEQKKHAVWFYTRGA